MTTRLVLAGLGHAHLFVLEAAARGRLAGVDVTVCTGDDAHVYSGMVPGWIRDRYVRAELALDVDALCRRAGATRVPHHVTGVDPRARIVRLADGGSVAFDLCSIAVGSRPAGLTAVPGAAEHALALKPLANVAQLRDRLDRLAASGRGAVTVVGGGLAGLEVAFAVRARLAARADAARGDAARWPDARPARLAVTVLAREPQLLPSRPRLARRVGRALARHGIVALGDAEVTRVEAGAVHLADGRRVASDLTLWATGAAAPAWLAETGLATDARGCLLVDGHLRAVAVAGAASGPWTAVFAAGDCATPLAAPATEKAGVYAVRMGPVLARTLAAAAAGRALPAPYVPQRRFLTLVDTGDGRAIASRGRWTAEGRWVAWWKDRLDRGFVQRFERLCG
jgi:selenide,water dikinase